MKRLFLPSIIFSLFYALLFYNKYFKYSVFIYDIMSGLGHMWYLPMLFWCFIAGYFLLRWNKISEKVKIVLLLLLTAISVISLPFRISNACYYLFFFYLGTVMWKHKKDVYGICTHVRNMIILIILFVFVFLICNLIRDNLILWNFHSPIFKAFVVLALHYAKVMYATMGMLLVYVLCVWLSKRYTVSENLLKFNLLCFGIYLFQQFVLKLLYYYSPLPLWVGTYALPWCGFVTTLFMSIFLAWIMRKTKFGRKLI